MKLSFDSVTIEADTVSDIAALIALIPSRQSSRPAIQAPVASDQERELRDAYRTHYGKGFTMKGREGSPLDALETLAASGWPKMASGGMDDELEAPPASVSDDGSEFI